MLGQQKQPQPNRHYTIGSAVGWIELGVVENGAQHLEPAVSPKPSYLYCSFSCCRCSSISGVDLACLECLSTAQAVLNPADYCSPH